MRKEGRKEIRERKKEGEKERREEGRERRKEEKEGGRERVREEGNNKEDFISYGSKQIRHSPLLIEP